MTSKASLVLAGWAALAGAATTGGCMGLVSLDDRPCPCATGFLCCPTTNTCVAASQASQCAGPEASVTDGASAPDTAAATDAPPDAPWLMTGWDAANPPRDGMSDATGVDAPPEAATDAAIASDAGAEAGSEAGACDEGGPHSAGKWSPIATGPFSPRESPLFVWAGDDTGNGRLVVWGGRDIRTSPTTPLADGALYDPRADAWSSMSSVGAPPASSNLGAVWTGSRVLVWGGIPYAQTDPVRSYDPQSNSWSSGSQPPVFLYSPSYLAWTGTRLLLYFAGKGAVYDPAGDQWWSMDTTGAPCANLGSAVWTGSAWIVFGGQACDSSAYVNAGAAYDPASNAWTALPTDGAPSARGNHGAVWDGTEMIIWGGLDDSGAQLADGAAYDPAARRWRPITAQLGSVPTSGFTAVGIPEGMLTWGGNAGNEASPFGGLLDACTAQWSPLPSNGQPSIRMGNSAAWTGREMIVWGGWESASQPAATGGRYVP